MADKEKLYLKGGPQLIDMGDHCQEFCGGDELVGVSEGTLDSLIRLGQAVTKDKLIDEPEPVVHDTALNDRSVRDIGLSDHIAQSLWDAKLKTVGQVLKYGSEHGSLDGIPGIGEASEKAIQKAITDASK